MTVPPGSRPLLGRHVRLDPSVPADADELFAALDDERVWTYGYGGGPSGRAQGPADWVTRMETAVADGRAMFTVRLVADDRVVGTSSLGDTHLVNERTHLGWTAYSPSV